MTLRSAPVSVWALHQSACRLPPARGSLAQVSTPATSATPAGRVGGQRSEGCGRRCGMPFNVQASLALLAAAVCVVLPRRQAAVSCMLSAGRVPGPLIGRVRGR